MKPNIDNQPEETVQTSDNLVNAMDFIGEDQTAQSFGVKDCAIIRRMGGVSSAINLRELRERVSSCPIECLYYHFCETQITPTFDDPEFRNDLALWAAHVLRDRVLAEKLGIINPYTYDDLEQLRERVVEIIDERLSELQYFPSVPMGEEFMFMRAVTVVFDTGIYLHKPEDLITRLPFMSHSSIYYHFLEARRRTPDRVDDFTFWMQFLEAESESIINALAQVDFYFLSLPDLKQVLIKTLRELK
jgi:hypothetical protein